MVFGIIIINIGIKEVELDEASNKFEKEKELFMKGREEISIYLEKEKELTEKLSSLQKTLEKQYESKQIGKLIMYDIK